MPATRHHLLPKLYLRRWANARDRVRLVDLQEDRAVVTHVDNAVVQSNFYSVDTNDDSPADIVESALSELEGYCASAFVAVDTGMWPLDAENRTALAHFVALQLVRGERFRASTNDVADKLGRMILDLSASDSARLRRLMRAARDGAEPTDDEVAKQAEFLSRGEYTISESQNSLVALFLQLACDLVQPVFDCSWDLLTGAGRERLISADEPIALWRSPGTMPAWAGFGIATAHDITLPLDPTRCLRFSFRGFQPDRQFVVEDRVIAVLNHRTALAAHRFLVTECGWEPTAEADQDDSLGPPSGEARRPVRGT